MIHRMCFTSEMRSIEWHSFNRALRIQSSRNLGADNADETAEAGSAREFLMNAAQTKLQSAFQGLVCCC